MSTAVTDAAVRVPAGFATLAGRAVAYAAVPLSLVAGPTIESIVGMIFCVYAVAIIGVVAAWRGAPIPKLVADIGYVFFACFALLFAVELINGDVFATPRPGNADFFGTYMILLAAPFFVIGLSVLRVDRRHFEWAIIATVSVTAVWTVYQYGVQGFSRASGFNGLNPNTMGMIVLLWGLFLLASALRGPKPDGILLIGALIALIPTALAASKIVWACCIVGYTIIFVWWAISWKRWRTLASISILTIAVIGASLQFSFVQDRISQMSEDFGAFLVSGDTSGGTFGIRVAAWIGGLHAFLAQPFIGHGLADVRIAALTYRPDWVTDFSYLWHLHNQYVTNLVAFGFLGLAFLIAFLGVFAYVAWRARDEGVRRFCAVAPIVIAAYISVELLFPRTPLYGTVFVLLGLCMLIVTRQEEDERRSSIYSRISKASEARRP